jgi:lysozyme family protein
MLNRRLVVSGLLTTIITSRSFAEAYLSDVDLPQANRVLALANKLGVLPNEPRAAGPLSEMELADIVNAAVAQSADKEKEILAGKAGLLLSDLTIRQKESRDEDPTEPAPAAVRRPSDLKSHYENLANGAVIDEIHRNELLGVARRIAMNRPQYEEVATPSGIPWYIIGCLHYREANLNFMGHLHNGDPLLMKTVNVPPDRPNITPWPPQGKTLRQTWALSALDALTDIQKILKNWNEESLRKWSVQGTCFILESYNGFGCYNHGIATPYLWNYTNRYTAGGYGSDGHYSSIYKSKQAGLYSVLLALCEISEDVKTNFVLNA